MRFAQLFALPFWTTKNESRTRENKIKKIKKNIYVIDVYILTFNITKIFKFVRKKIMAGASHLFPSKLIN